MKELQKVTILKQKEVELVKKLFGKEIPEQFWVRPNISKITHFHTYGGLTPFFKGLTEGKLMGTKCTTCEGAEVWLPPRVDCPDCWHPMNWQEVDTKEAKVYTYSTTNYPGAGFKASVPCPLISVEIPGVCTKLMSYLSSFKTGELYIGMPIKPIFRRKKPTYTILDLSWIPARL